MNTLAIKSFNECSIYQFQESQKQSIQTTIESLDKDFILYVDEQQYIDSLASRYFFEPIELDISSEYIPEPRPVSINQTERMGREYIAEGYQFWVTYKFSGNGEVFKIHPTTWTITSRQIYLDPRTNTVSFTFQIFSLNPVEYEREKKSCFDQAFKNIGNANKDMQAWNSQLPGLIRTIFTNRKEKLLKENSFFQQIGITVNKEAANIFSVPTVKKKVIPIPTVIKKEYNSEPGLSNEIYDDILMTVNSIGKILEKKPAIYRDKVEEEIRDYFVSFLETRYEGATATGETFNQEGKTDILVKFAKDGSNLFVAECKVWHGASEMHNAIDQLLKYLTFRDSKTALVLFVKNLDFTSTLETIQREVPLHPHYVKSMGKRDDSSFSYIFSLPQDKNKHFQLEVISFHFHKEPEVKKGKK
jgi:hypothetical protein